MTVHGPPTADRRPSVRTTGKPMFTLTLLASLGAPKKTNCTSMLWSIDGCQNRASADQYHLAVSRAQVSTHLDRIFFEVIRWLSSSLRKQPTFGYATTAFPAKWRLRNERRNSTPMTRHYPDLGSASDWSCPRGKCDSINQKRYSDLGSDAPSVWNFCAGFSDVIWRGNQ